MSSLGLSQSIEPDLISTSGRVEVKSDIYVQWSLGEWLVGEMSGDDALLTSGFHAGQTTQSNPSKYEIQRLLQFYGSELDWIQIASECENPLVQIICSYRDQEGWKSDQRLLLGYDGPYPINMTYQKFDGSDWNNVYREIIEYNNDGNVSRITRQCWVDMSGFSNDSKSEFSYLNESDISEVREFLWEENSWALKGRLSFAYDGGGFLEEILHEKPIGDSGSDFDKIAREIFQQNDQDALAEQRYETYNAGVWNLDSSRTNTYENGFLVRRAIDVYREMVNIQTRIHEFETNSQSQVGSEVFSQLIEGGDESDFDLKNNYSYQYDGDCLESVLVQARVANTWEDAFQCDFSYSDGSGSNTNLPDLRVSRNIVKDSVFFTRRPEIIEYDISNIGITPSEPSQVHLIFSMDSVLTDEDSLLIVKNLPALDIGSTISFTDTLELPYQINCGEFFIFIEVDPLNTVAELNEDNNSAKNKLFYLIKPDLTPHLSLEIEQPIVKRGDILQIECQIYNDTVVDVFDMFQNVILLSADSIPDQDDQKLSVLSLDTLLSDSVENFGLSFPIPADIDTGLYYLICQADPDDSIVERNENNNVDVIPIYITDYPDLIITDCFATQTFAGLTDTILLYAEITNIGRISAAESLFGAYISADTQLDPQDRIIEEIQMSPFEANQSFQWTYELIVQEYFTSVDVVYIILCPDPEDLIEECEEDNCKYIEIEIVEEIIKTDLTVVNIEFTEVCLLIGNDYALQYEIANTGNGESPPTFTGIYASRDSILEDNDVKYSSVETTILEPGQRETYEETVITESLDTGFYYFFVCADETQIVDECVEINNCSYTLIEVKVDTTIDPNKPDITIIDVEVGADCIVPGTDVNVEYTLKNLSAVATGRSSTVAFYLSDDRDRDGEDQLLFSRWVPSIPGDACYSLTESILIPSAISGGNKYILVCYDPDDVIMESREYNNCDSDDFDVLKVGRADLYVREVNLDVECLIFGEFVGLNCDVENVGYSVSENTQINFYLSLDQTISATDVLIYTHEIVQLEACSFLEINQLVHITDILLGSKYYLIAEIDPGQIVDEMNEQNNIAVFETEYKIPEIVIQKETQTTTIEISAQTTYTETVEVINLGSLSADTFAVGMFISEDMVLDDEDPLLCSFQVDALLPQESQSIVFESYISEDFVGHYYFIFKAVIFEEIIEFEIEDNICYLEVVITEPEDMGDFDLIVDFSEFNYTQTVLMKNSHPFPGDDWENIFPFTSEPEVNNVRYDVAVYLSKDFSWSSDDLLVLSAGQNSGPNSYNNEYRFTVSQSGCPEESQNCRSLWADLTFVPNGIYYVLFVADPENKIKETDESNNIGFYFKMEIDEFEGGQCACPSQIEDKDGKILLLYDEPRSNGEITYDAFRDVYRLGCHYYFEGGTPRAARQPADVVWVANELGPTTWGSGWRFCDQFGPIRPVVRNGLAILGDYHDGGNNAVWVDYSEGEAVVEGLVSCVQDRAVALNVLCEDFMASSILVAEPDKISFSTLNPEDSKLLKIRAEGPGSVTISEIRIEGDLEISIANIPSLPYALSGGSMLVLDIELAGADHQPGEAARIILENDSQNTTLEIPVEILAPELKITSLQGTMLYAGQSTILIAEIIDPVSGNIITDFPDLQVMASTVGAESTPGLEMFGQIFEIRQGTSVGYSYNAFKGHFTDQTVIDNGTLLSGKTKISFTPVGTADIAPKSYELNYACPIDFELSDLKIQQGVFNLDHPISLKLTASRDTTYPARLLISDHLTYVVAPVSLQNKTGIKYDEIRFEDFSGKLEIAVGATDIHSIAPNSLSYAGWEIELRENYTFSEIHRMRNNVSAELEKEHFKQPGMYDFLYEISYDKIDPDLIIHPDDMSNDQMQVSREFVETEEFHLLVYLAKLEGITEYPNIDYADLKDYVLDHLLRVYPVNYDKFRLINTSIRKKSFNTLSQVEVFRQASQLLKVESGAMDILLIGDRDMVELICGSSPGAGAVNGCAEYDDGDYQSAKVGLIHEDGATAAHELGHLLGLWDTYAAAPNKPGVVNPRRPTGSLIGNGNYLEAGNIVYDSPRIRRSMFESKDNIDDLFVYREFMGNSVIAGGLLNPTGIDRLTWHFLYDTHFEWGSKSKNLEDDWFLAVSGVVDKTGMIDLDPISHLTDPPYVSDPSPLGQYAIVLKDEMEQIIFEFRFDIDFEIAESGPVDTISFLYYIPFAENANSMVITYQDEEIISQTFSDNPPEIDRFESVRDQQTGRYFFDWQASDMDSDTLSFTLTYTPDGSENIPIEVNIRDTSTVWVPFESFKPEGVFRLTVSDGYYEDFEEIALQDVTTDTEIVPDPVSSIQIFPHPIGEELNIYLTLGKNSDFLLEVNDIRGQQILESQFQGFEGENHLTFQTYTWSEGLYIIHIQDMKTREMTSVKLAKF